MTTKVAQQQEPEVEINSTTEQETTEIRKKKAQTPTKDTDFSCNVITNFMNNHYHSISSEPRIKFKTPTKAKKPKIQKPDTKTKRSNQETIDLTKYEGIQDFVCLYNEMTTRNPDIDFEPIVKTTFDLRLRAFLDIVDNLPPNEKKGEKRSEKLLREYVIPQLGFEKPTILTPKDYNEAIIDFWNNELWFKKKIFNVVFPHGTRSEEKDPIGLNVLYLQESTKFQDEVLDMVINKGMNEIDILKEIQKKMSSTPHISPDEKIDQHDKIKLGLQYLHQEVPEYIINPPVTEVDGVAILDTKWADKLKAVEEW